jgi:flagellar biosynthetic protein FlhB
MAAETFQDKSEKPTDKRLEQAKTKGQTAKSIELSSCFIILFSSLFIYFTFSQLFQETYKMYIQFIQRVDIEIDASTINEIIWLGVGRWMAMVLPIFVLLIVISIFSTVIQTGFLWATEAMKINFGALNPLSGIGRFFTVKAVVEQVKSLTKVGILVYVCYTLITQELPNILALPQHDTRYIATYMGQMCFRLALKIGVIFLFLAGLDYMFQRWQFRKSMMMTKQEVIEEHKESEGNPLVKSRIRSLQREFAKRRMLEDVKKADVIITNPTTFAVALTYTINEMSAPKVVAKGAGFVAEKIKEVARQHRVPIVENKPLARGLFYAVKIGDYIPEKFYVVVAELLAQVFRQKRRSLS